MKAEDIKTIDFDLKIDNDTFVQTTITNVASRYKVFYCFKNGDTREDGEDRCTEDTFASITKMIADAIDNITSEPVSISSAKPLSSPYFLERRLNRGRTIFERYRVKRMEAGTVNTTIISIGFEICHIKINEPMTV